MWPVVIAALNRDLYQARPLVGNEATCTLEPEHTGGQFGATPIAVSKTLSEMPPAIADFIRELLD